MPSAVASSDPPYACTGERKTYVADAVFTVCGCEEEEKDERKRKWLKNCCREFDVKKW